MTSVQPRNIHPRNWGVRAKAAVIVAVPLLVLSGFGAIQIAGEVQHASRSATLAEQISALPAVMTYATSVGAVVGVSDYGLQQTENSALFDDYSAQVAELSNREDLDPHVAEEIGRILDVGSELIRVSASDSSTVPMRTEQLRAFGMQVEHTVRALVGQAENVAAFSESERLLDLWQARFLPFDQAAAFTRPALDSDLAREMLETAFAIERGVYSALRGTEEDQEALEELRTGAQTRHAMLLNPDSAAVDIQALSGSLLTSVEAGGRLIDTSVDRIVTALNDQRDAAQAAAIRTAIFVAIAVACAVTVALVLARLLISSLRRLRDDTARAAYQELPAAVAAIRGGSDPATVAITPIGVDTAEEIGEVARAVDGVSTQAVRLAAEQAALRHQITAMLETLARRNRSLVDRQLSLIEALEFQERDPERLQRLFELDHLASRMRRTGESLLVLAGTRSRHTSRAATPLEDIMRASVSQVENYERVRLGAVPPVTLTGGIVDDLIHLLTELLDNSLRASDPSTSVVLVVSPATENGLLLEVIDRGIGIPPEDLEQINHRLFEGTETDAQAARHMGLYVAGRVAQRHGLWVRLRPSMNTGAARGITASVHLPSRAFAGKGIKTEWVTVDRPRRLPDPDSALGIDDNTRRGSFTVSPTDR